MKVYELMTKETVSCHPDTNLAVAGALMWENDCGVLPVVDEDGKVSGILTDRDICIALATRDDSSSHITARDVAAKNVITCSPDDDVHSALNKMRTEKLHRLPVVNAQGVLQGILSLNDLVLHAEKTDGRKRSDLTYEDVMETYQGICEHRPRKIQVIAA